MKPVHIKTHVGVWLDHNTASFYTYNADKPEDGFKLVEEIEGPGVYTTTSEKSLNNTKKADRHKFYSDIAKRLGDYDEILLFGPGKAQEELHNELTQNKHFLNKRIDVKTENRLTEHQRVALVRDHFVKVLQ